MINVKFEKLKDSGIIILRVEGHAGQNAKGKDIVCSAASVLATTVAQYLIYVFENGGLEAAPEIILDNGNALIAAEPREEYIGEVLNAYFVAEIGFSLLANSYPEYLKLKMFGEP